jgi:hypothetical protein
VPHRVANTLKVSGPGRVEIQRGYVQMPQRSQRYGDLKDLLELLVGPLAESVAVVGSSLVSGHNEEIVAGVDFHGGFDFRQ